MLGKRAGTLTMTHTNTEHDMGADAAVAVAERGLAAWREAKVAWLEAVAAGLPAGGSPVRPGPSAAPANGRAAQAG